MKIESVDFFYLKMPKIYDRGDGSQDALLVRIRAGGLEGWGECEASPLTSIASYVCPMSHSACKPLKHSLEGIEINDKKDIYRISNTVRKNSFDLLQANHTLSGIDIALWDILGKKLNEPVYKLLGYKQSYAKIPYASQLFGDDPEETYAKAQKMKNLGFKATKFGWGHFGEWNLDDDIQHLLAAREGMGAEAYLMIDAGTVWDNEIGEAKKRLPILKKIDAFWLEEPFANLALHSYNELSVSSPHIVLAGGEGCDDYLQAQIMIEHSGIQFIQIDAGRIGGITAAKKVADLAHGRGISYVNHTFTSSLALSASLQPFSGIKEDEICEYPTELQPLAEKISQENIMPDRDGYINLPDKPGLGIDIDEKTIREYLVDLEIRIGSKSIYYTPEV